MPARRHSKGHDIISEYAKLQKFCPLKKEGKTVQAVVSILPIFITVFCAISTAATGSFGKSGRHHIGYFRTSMVLDFADFQINAFIGFKSL